jgi:hypothetical protein
LETYRYTRMGIALVYAGLVLFVLAMIAIPLSILLRAAPLLLAAPLLWIASSLLSMIGRILCLSVPKNVGATGLIYAAVVCDVSSLFAMVSRMFSWLPDLSSFSGMLSVAAMLFFLMFLKKLAVFINDSESADRALSLLYLGIGLIIVMVAMIFIPQISILSLVLMLVGFFIYNRLLSGLRKSLGIAVAPTDSV